LLLQESVQRMAIGYTCNTHFIIHSKVHVIYSRVSYQYAHAIKGWKVCGLSGRRI